MIDYTNMAFGVDGVAHMTVDSGENTLCGVEAEAVVSAKGLVKSDMDVCQKCLNIGSAQIEEHMFPNNRRKT